MPKEERELLRATKFNDKVAPGDLVEVKLDSGKKQITRIKTKAEVISGIAVVLLEDIAGYYLINRIKKLGENNGKTKTKD